MIHYIDTGFTTYEIGNNLKAIIQYSWIIIVVIVFILKHKCD